MTTMVKKANTFEILNHWIMAVSFSILAITGSGFLFQIEPIGSLFGGFNQMRTVHNYVGVFFAISVGLSIFNYIPEALAFSGEDFAWLLKGGGYFTKGTAMPPQGRLNAGQKSYYLFVLLAAATLSVTGLMIWLIAGVKEWILPSHLIHNIAFVLFLMAVPFHIYMATLASPGSLRVMLSGMVPVEWARKRHGKWMRELGH